jgi:sulfide:quinone oxidoreductase
MTFIGGSFIPSDDRPGARIQHRGKHRFQSVFSRSGYARAMDRFKVVICGGGIAAVEGLLRLRRLLGDAVSITLLAPNDELRYRPLAVQEPFSRPGARRYPLRKIARSASAEWFQEALEWVDPEGQIAHTAEGRSVEYDALLLAVGARADVPYEHVTVFDDAHADDAYRGLVQDVEEGYTRSVALLVPEGPAWPLPVYELALMTAQRAESMGMEGIGVHVVTAEPAPLAAFGAGASEAVAELLESARVRIHLASSAEVPASRKLVIQPEGRELEPERIVAMPRLRGPGIRDVPADQDGFIPIDELTRVRGLEPRVFAAGDAANLQIKHGGVGAQMADTAAAGIAALAGAPVEVEPMRAVLRGVLYTGAEPLYLTARIEDGRVESEVARDRPWPADEKVVAEELGPFLRSLD